MKPLRLFLFVIFFVIGVLGLTVAALLGPGRSPQLYDD